MTDRDRHADARVWGSSIGALRIDLGPARDRERVLQPLRAPLADARGLAALRRVREQLEPEAK